MSKIFKAPRVNVGQTYEVTISDDVEVFQNKTIFNTIRSSDLRGLDPDSAASTIIEDAANQANEIVEGANCEAEKIITNANDEAQRIQVNAQEQGYQDGYQQGYAKGLEEGKRETEDLANQALNIKEELEKERLGLTKTVEAQVIDLIIQSVKKIVGNELATNEDVICSVVVKALNKIGSGENIVVKVSQDDFKVLDENKINVVSESKNVSEFEVKEDLSLKKGDCIIETECGTIDAGITTQVDKFEDIIIQTMGIDNHDE